MKGGLGGLERRFVERNIGQDENGTSYFVDLKRKEESRG